MRARASIGRLAIAFLLACSGVASAQQGDHAGEAQPDLPDTLVIPPAPVLTPEQALASFTIKDGFRIELVAAEPDVEDPVAMSFDAAGRMWVVEMRGFMPNVDGENEREPVGRIVVLEDKDQDGRVDSTTVFLDEIVLPRAVAPVYDGALVIAPPHLLFCRDTDGDGRADEQRLLHSGFGGIESPEHAGNGLMHGLDNWIHLSQHALRFRFDGNVILTQPTPGHGQWGITRDDLGRIYYTTNSDPLRGDVFPLHYASRNPNHGSVVGINERIANDMSTWPIRVTPGINRGYQPDMLRDGKLTRFTSACGPVIYRGDLFPEEFRGNAFVCEPAAYLVKRYVIDEKRERPVAVPAYEQSEFLASTDERFRPVNAVSGPDGALYLVDMYRGMIQHRMFVTTFLRKQVIERGLDKPVGLGRIYRVVPDGAPAMSSPDLASAIDEELVAELGHANSWRGDTAQRLLVERRAARVAPAVREIARRSPLTAARLRALWTLDGTNTLAVDDVLEAAKDDDPYVRAAAVRLAERWLDASPVLDALERMIGDQSRTVRSQLAFSLGESSATGARMLLHRLVTQCADERQVRSAAVSGLHAEEHLFLARLLGDPAWSRNQPGYPEMIGVLASAVLRSGASESIEALLALASARMQPSRWQTEVIVKRLADAMRVATDKPRSMTIEHRPAGWEDLLACRDDDLRDTIAKIDEHLMWPGKSLARGSLGPAPLTAAEQVRFEKGKRFYGALCVTCHQLSGRGTPGTAPTIVGTPMVLGSERRLARILLHGMSGPVEVDGEKFNGAMPKAPLRRDDSIAAILTYIRRAWGNDAAPVTPESVAAVREETKTRLLPWTNEELEQIP